MATLEFIHYMPRRYEVQNGHGCWVGTGGGAIERLPQLVWGSHVPWAEANLWALEQAETKDIKTVHSAMTHLLGYAKWLEDEGVDWWHFPARESQRCLTRFRGALIQARNGGEIAPSTASARMSSVIRFYRWLRARKLLSTNWPLWTDVHFGIRLTDAFGFDRTLQVVSTNLSIRDTKIAGGLELEDGVMPLTSTGAFEVLRLANEEASEELSLMLQLGFGTGLRLGSILDLKLGTIDQASADSITGWWKIDVGPSARPSVATKYGNSGSVLIPPVLLERLRTYAYSTRRLKRQAIAAGQCQNLLFLTRFGRPYAGPSSRAVNVEVARLRAKGVSRGVDVLRDFHFHRSRATFATMLMRVALRFLPVPDAVKLVREACLHKDEATTLKYVKFVESSKAMADAANAYSAVFMGLVTGCEDESR